MQGKGSREMNHGLWILNLCFEWRKQLLLEAMKLVHLKVKVLLVKGAFTEVITDFFHRGTPLWFKWIFQLHLIAELLISLWKSVTQLPFYFAFSGLPLVSSAPWPSQPRPLPRPRLASTTRPSKAQSPSCQEDHPCTLGFFLTVTLNSIFSFFFEKLSFILSSFSLWLLVFSAGLLKFFILDCNSFLVICPYIWCL